MIHIGRGLARMLFYPLLLVLPLVQAQEPEAPDVKEKIQSEAEAVATVSQAAGGLPTLPPREEFAGILERPLFNEDRRPVAESGDDQTLTSAAELREQWKLTGIIMVGAEVRAMLQQREGDKRLTLVPGMPLDASWMLEEINADSVIMDSGDEQVRLELMTPRDTTPVATAENAVTERSEQGNTDEQSRQPDTRESEPRRLRQSTEVSDE